MRPFPIELIHDIVFRLNDLTCLALGFGFLHQTMEHEHAIIQQNGGPGCLLTTCLTHQDSDLRILRYLRTRFPNELTPEIALVKAIATGNVLAIKRVSLLWNNVRYSDDAWITMAMHHAAWKTTDALLSMKVIVNWLETRSPTDRQIKNVYWILQHQLDNVDTTVKKPLACLALLERHPDQTWVADRLSDDILRALYDRYATLDNARGEEKPSSNKKEILSIAAHLGNMPFFERVLGQEPNLLIEFQSRLFRKMVAGAHPVMAIRLVRAFQPTKKLILLDNVYPQLLRALMFKTEYLEDALYLNECVVNYRGGNIILYAKIAREDIEGLKVDLQDRRKQCDIVIMLVQAEKFHLFRPIGIPEVFPIEAWPPLFFKPSIVHQVLQHERETGLSMLPGSRVAVGWFSRANDDLRIYMLQRGLISDRFRILHTAKPLDSRSHVKWSRFLEYSPFIQPETEEEEEEERRAAFNRSSSSSVIIGNGSHSSSIEGEASGAAASMRPKMEDDYYQSCPLDQLPQRILIDGSTLAETCRLMDRMMATQCQLVRVHTASEVQQSPSFGYSQDGNCWAPWYQSRAASRGQPSLDRLAQAGVLVRAVDPVVEGEDDGEGLAAMVDELAALLAPPQMAPLLHPPEPRFHRNASSVFFIDPRVPAATWLGEHWYQGRHFQEWFKALDTHLYCFYLENSWARENK